MTRRRIHKLLPLLVLAATLLTGGPVFAQESCADLCGDANDDGVFNISDVTYLMDWLYIGGPEPPCLDEADVDGYELVNVSDIRYIIDCLLSCVGGPYCPPVEPPLDPELDSSFYIQVHPQPIVWAGQTSVSFILYLGNAEYIQALSLPLRFRVGESAPTGVTYEWLEGIYLFDGTQRFVVGDSGEALISAFTIVDNGPPPGLRPLVRITLEFAPDNYQDRSVTMEWTRFPPEQNGILVQGPLVMTEHTFPTHRHPDISYDCCLLRGDANHDHTVNVSDLTRMVCILFGGVCSPFPCPEEADVDRSGAFNISDLTYLVNYLFNTGPEPPLCR